jgi:hypothetical protein
VDDRVQPLHRRVVAEHAAAEHCTVERAVGSQHPVAELVGDRSEHGRPRLLHVADHLIGVDDDRAVLGEAPPDRGLPRRDSAGEGNERHATRMPRAATFGRS